MDWFDPARLFAAGYPPGITSALRVIPAVRAALDEEIGLLAPRRGLEVGPGDAPLLAGAGTVYVDVVPRFLAALTGARLVADLRALPFPDRLFDLAVAADVLTHVAPPARPAALAELARVARAVLVFNPEPGTPEVDGSAVDTGLVGGHLAMAGFDIAVRRFRARAEAGDYDMTIVRATRRQP
jgi:SAM-dependent methyltransferase